MILLSGVYQPKVPLGKCLKITVYPYNGVLYVVVNKNEKGKYVPMEWTLKTNVEWKKAICSRVHSVIPFVF